MADALAVGLASWIIQDGNYGDFACGDRAAFALEFYAENGLRPFQPQSEVAPKLTRSNGAQYKAVGYVMPLSEDWWVIDVGYLVFREERPPASLHKGDWVRGEIYIGIDPFFYFERLAHTAKAPALIYDWEIQKIELLVAPWIEAESPAGWHTTRPVLRRDPDRLAYREITRTNAWEDDAGRGDYILYCHRAENSPRRYRP